VAAATTLEREHAQEDIAMRILDGREIIDVDVG
jgi:hypothetical protein